MEQPDRSRSPPPIGARAVAPLPVPREEIDLQPIVLTLDGLVRILRLEVELLQKRVKSLEAKVKHLERGERRDKRSEDEEGVQ